MYIFVWVFIAIVFYYAYQFIQVLIKMKQDIVLPVTAEELSSIWKEPQKTVKPPTYSSQKAGIIFYVLVLIFIIGMFILNWQFRQVVSMIYFLVMIPVFHLSNVLNLFAVTKDGILCGARFASWENIKSYEFVRIDVNHNYYGFSREVNDQYELRIKTRFSTLSCIITKDEMKEKLSDLLGKESSNYYN